jgi:hypothetical protein
LLFPDSFSSPLSFLSYHHFVTVRLWRRYSAPPPYVRTPSTVSRYSSIHESLRH